MRRLDPAVKAAVADGRRPATRQQRRYRAKLDRIKARHDANATRQRRSLPRDRPDGSAASDGANDAP